MQYYIITFQVTIDGKDMETGLVGNASATNDYNPNLFKGMVIRQLRKNHPGSKVVVVKFVDTKEVSEDEFYKQSKNFLEIKQD